MRYLWIGLGGAVGSMLRGAISLNVDQSHFPWATLAINLSGAFALGVLLSIGIERVSEDVATPLGVGVLGGYTTFSTFAWEGASLSRSGRMGTAVAYVAASVIGGLAAASAGHLVGRSLR